MYHRFWVKQCISNRSRSRISCWQSEIDDVRNLVGKSGDSRAEMQYGCSQCGFWGGSFCESREKQHQQPRGSSASLCAGVDARFESQSCTYRAKFRSLTLSPPLTAHCTHTIRWYTLVYTVHLIKTWKILFAEVEVCFIQTKVYCYQWFFTN